MTPTAFLTRPFWKEPLSLLRIWLGIAFIMHGTPGIFNPDFMDGHIGAMQLFDMPFPALIAYLSKGGELIGGVLLVLGLFTRPAAIIIAFNMLAAVFFALQGNIFDDFQGEISFTYLIMAVVIFLAGPDKFTLDRKLFGKEELVGVSQ